MEFKDNLRELREKRGLTKKQLAEKALIGYTSVNAYENGTIQPSLYALIQLSKALNVKIQKLIGDT